MATERRRQLILAALVVVLLSVIYRLWTATAPAPAAASNRSAGSAPAGRSQPAGRGGRGAGAEDPQGITAPDVHLESLDAERLKPTTERNLFRFRPKAPPPPPPQPPRPPVIAQNPVPTAPPTPVGPAPPPPITLRFIGILDVPGRGQKIAALSDGRNTFHGVEGDIIEGRYRILKICVE